MLSFSQFSFIRWILVYPSRVIIFVKSHIKLIHEQCMVQSWSSKALLQSEASMTQRNPSQSGSGAEKSIESQERKIGRARGSLNGEIEIRDNPKLSMQSKGGSGSIRTVQSHGIHPLAAMFGFTTTATILSFTPSRSSSISWWVSLHGLLVSFVLVIIFHGILRLTCGRRNQLDSITVR